MTAPVAIAAVAPRALTAFDWVLVAMVVVSTLAGFRRGIIRALSSLAGLVAGVMIASWNFARFAAWLRTTFPAWTASAATMQVVAFVAIVVATLIAFAMLAALVRKGVRAVGLGFVDRLLGAAFGLLRGVLLGVAAMMAMAAFAPGSGWPAGSRLAPYFLAGAHAVSFVVPKHFHEQISDGTSHLLQKTPDLLWLRGASARP